MYCQSSGQIKDQQGLTGSSAVYLQRWQTTDWTERAKTMGLSRIKVGLDRINDGLTRIKENSINLMLGEPELRRD